jgi:hypothetical protein
MLLLIRVHTWSDELTLSRINVARHPESSRSNYFYANALLRNYRRAGVRGLSETERLESLVLSRHYFERMYQTNNRDVAALVMLFYLDQQFFPDLEEQADWLSKLEDLLLTRVLQPSDWNALAVFFEVLLSAEKSVENAKVESILGALIDRYPESGALQRFRYNYLSSTNVTGSAVMEPLLQARAYAPGDPWINYHLAYEQSRQEDFAGVYDTVRLWMLHDSDRLNLHLIKSLLSSETSEDDSFHD